MNKVLLMGRLTKDPEIIDKSTKIAKWNLAVDRKFKKDGDPDADFLPCVAFGKTAEFVESYFKKGIKVVVEGRIQTGSYVDNKTAQKVYTWDVIVESVEFAESKKSGETKQADDFLGVADGLVETELPF